MFNWLSFLLFVFIMTFTPGPNNIMSMNNAKNAGLKKCLPFSFGVFTGAVVVFTLCLLFSSALTGIMPRIQLPMKILGAVYMVYLAVKPFLPSRADEEKKRRGGFLIGVALQLINAKLFIFAIAVMSSFILPHYREPVTLALFVLFLCALGFSSTVCWALFGSLLSLAFKQYAKAINIVMALLLLYCAISLFL